MPTNADLPEPPLVDARGLKCPWPVVRLSRALREGVGPVIVVADDPIAPAEIGTFAAAHDFDAIAVDTAIGPGFRVGR